MSKTLEFKVFCFESYKAENGLTGKQTMTLFKESGVLDYLDNCYDTLHTTGRNYIVQDINLFINARKKIS